MAAKIRVIWPDGAICGICFTTALRTRGSCSGCGEERLLPGKATDGTDICRDCAGITTNMTCEGCGTETERFRAGHCIRCVLRTDLDQLLHPNSPPDLRLKRLIRADRALNKFRSSFIGKARRDLRVARCAVVRGSPQSGAARATTHDTTMP